MSGQAGRCIATDLEVGLQITMTVRIIIAEPDTGRFAQEGEVTSDEAKRARKLMDRGEWEAARRLLEDAVKRAASAELLEDLGLAASWCEDGAATIDARERAFAAYRYADDRRSAARMALLLVLDYLEFRGEQAIANGRLQRARRLLDSEPPCYEHGLLAYTEGYLRVDLDPAKAERCGKRTLELAEALPSVELQMLGLALCGFALVNAGEIVRGMDLLDESTAIAVAGEAKDLTAISQSCCQMICACEQVRDYDRAEQWCRHVKEFARKWKLRSIFAYCRTRYGLVLIYRGRWQEAESELLAAERELGEYRPGIASESIVRLGELRRRQGRLGEAWELFERASPNVFALLGRSAVSLDRGDFESAVEFAERFLRNVPVEDRSDRLKALELIIAALTELGRPHAAAEHLAELKSIAEFTGTSHAKAVLSDLNGRLALASGDLEAACRHFSDAADLFDRDSDSYVASIVRLRLATALRALGRHGRACSEAQHALAACRELGAAREVERLEAFLGDRPQEVLQTGEAGRNAVPADDVAPHARPPAVSGGELPSAREIEILRLIAYGKSNREIADTLFLSVRTVERHLSNVYLKIGASGKSARAVAVAYAFRHGIV